MGWSEKRLREYQKNNQSGASAARQRAAQQKTEESPSFRNTIAAAYEKEYGVPHNNGEESFVTAWKQHTKIPFPFQRGVAVRQNRKMNFDFAIPDLLLAVEIDGDIHSIIRSEGTIWMNAKQAEADREKWRFANIDGWTLLNYTDREIYNNPTKVIKEVLEAIEKRREAAGAKGKG